MLDPRPRVRNWFDRHSIFEEALVLGTFQGLVTSTLLTWWGTEPWSSGVVITSVVVGVIMWTGLAWRRRGRDKGNDK